MIAKIILLLAPDCLWIAYNIYRFAPELRYSITSSFLAALAQSLVTYYFYSPTTDANAFYFVISTTLTLVLLWEFFTGIFYKLKNKYAG